MERKLKYEGKELEYDTRYSSNYNWDGFARDAIEKFKPNTHKKIIAFITKDKVAQDILIANEKEKKLEVLRIAANDRLIALKKAADESFGIKGVFEVVIKLAKEGDSLYSFNEPTLRLKKLGDKDVIGYLSKTTSYSKPWEVYMPAGKTTRYASLKNALKKYVERYNTHTKELKIAHNEEVTKKDNERRIEEFCKAKGLEFSKDWHSYNRYGRRYSSDGYYIYSGHKEGLKMRFVASEKEGVSIIHITLNNPTADNMSKIMAMTEKGAKNEK